MNKKIIRTTYRHNPSIHQLIREKSFRVNLSQNRYVNNIIHEWFKEGKDVVLEKLLEKKMNATSSIF